MIEITQATADRFDVQLPFRHVGFLTEFKLKVNLSQRCWDAPRRVWHIWPTDREMLDTIAGMIRGHFNRYQVIVSY